MARPLILAGVFAHPDDETWSLAGVFAAAAFVRVRPASRPADPPETSLVDAFPGADGG